jgi:mannose-6-phosphate isomerase-like protein (cupin superfamily)
MRGERYDRTESNRPGRGARDVRRALVAPDRRPVQRKQVFLAKAKGEFVLHSHANTDDLFLVLEGRLTIQLRERSVEIGPGELFVVPRGVQHCPRSDDGASILLIEPEGTPNTGDRASSAKEAEAITGSPSRTRSCASLRRFRGGGDPAVPALGSTQRCLWRRDSVAHSRPNIRETIGSTMRSGVRRCDESACK